MMFRKSKLPTLVLRPILFSIFFISLIIGSGLALADVVVDNGGPGTSYTGTWPVSGSANPYGTNSLWSRDGATYTWSMSGQPAGTYEVLMWWTSYATRATNVGIEVNATAGTTDLTVNQQVNGGQWNSLGIYYFNGSGSVRVTAANGATVSTCADAVWFRYLDVVVDNRDAATSHTGTWGISGAAGYYGADSQWSRDGATFSWHFSPSQTGLYDVGMWWTVLSSRSTNVPVRIEYNGGSATVNVNQRANGAQWNSLGSYAFVEGVDYRVTVTAQPGPSNTCADAVRFTFVPAPNQPPTAVIDSISPNPGQLEDEVAFSGHGTDPDGTVTGYQWESDLAGLLSTAASFAMSAATLGQGVHTISFFVMDDQGEWSPGVTRSLSIGNQLPTAVIDSVSPNPANVGQRISFSGHGTDADGTVTGYRWESNLDGFLSSAASFSTSSLTRGNHTITFRVYDNRGAASEAVTRALRVDDLPAESIIDNGAAGTSFTGTWGVSGATNPYGTNSLFSRDGATYTWSWTAASGGYSEVFMWWTVASSRSTSSPVRIVYDGGNTTVNVNQRANGGQWNSLGIYPFAAGVNYAVTITAANGSTVSTCADAVRFVKVQQPNPPVADFSADRQFGGAPLLVQFTDMSLGLITNWLWTFGDGQTSAEKNPAHQYQTPGVYRVSLTVTNAAGSNTKVQEGYINIVAAAENIYLGDGYAKDALFIPNTTRMLRDMGAVDQNGVLVYQNPSTNITYFIHTVKTPQGLEQALKEEGAHVIFNGHANYGLGASFAQGDEVYRQQIDSIRYIDDDRFTNFSTDMVSVKIDGVKYGQAYPNWEPRFKDGTSGIMPYDFSEGTPPYNYYITYRLQGDPTEYLVEMSDGTYLERFPDASTPAWYAANGSKPDPVLNREYFIINPSPDFNHCDFVGTWPIVTLASDDPNKEYKGYNYQYHNAGTGANTATWTLVVNTPGNYSVVATWQRDPANASNAPYTIRHRDGATTVRVDQTASGRSYTLGSFYFNQGAYTVTLSDAANGRVIADRISLNPLDNPTRILQAEFNADAISGAAPLAVAFTDLSLFYSSTGGTGITGWLWDFGDGTTSSEQNPSHTYTAPGIYTVSLRITDGSGAQETEVKTGLIAVGTTSPVRAEFSATNRRRSTRTTTNFVDLSSGNITAWQWNFGDGQTSTEQNPVHTYETPGAYTVTLTVTGPGGNSIHTETSYVYNFIGSTATDNAYQYKSHYFEGSSASYGKTVLNTSGARIPEEELRYSRMFYGSCNSCNYYVGTFHRGKMFCTVSDSEVYTAQDYLRDYLNGYTDAQILIRLNRIQAIHEFFDFNLRPPSMR